MSHIGIAEARTVEIVEAMKRLALTDPAQMSIIYQDWDGPTAKVSSLSSGTGSLDGTQAHSCLDVTSGATAGGVGYYGQIVTGDGNSLAFPPGTSGEWYLAARFKCVTVVDSHARLTAIATASEGLGLGFDGASSTTKFCIIWVNGAAVLSTVSVDTSWHVARAWRHSGATFISVDGETPVSGNTYPTASSSIAIVALNGTTNAAQTIRVDWQFVASPRSVT